MSIIRAGFAFVIVIALLQFARAEEPATKPAEPVDFRKLKEALPAELQGINRTEASGEKNSMGAVKMSHAHGAYVKDANNNDAPRIELDITDYSATQNLAEAMASWAHMDIDQESDEGYQKTTKVGNFPAFETYQKDGKVGQLQIFVAGRFIVSVSTTNLPAEQLKKIGEELKLEKLAAVK